jgi:hypothetical protein
MATLKPYPLPNLPPRAGVVGELGRQLLSGDLTALLPLRDALLEEGRNFEARWLVKGSVSRAFSPRNPFAATRTDKWESFSREVFSMLAFDIFDPAAVINLVQQTLLADQEEAQPQQAGDDAKFISVSPPLTQEQVETIRHFGRSLR